MNMKKIFSVWARVRLTQKPKWLDRYKKKYNNFHPVHVTLKQPCFVDEKKLDEMKNIVSEIINSFDFKDHKIKLVFEEVFVDKNDKSIMIRAKNRGIIMDLQDKLRTKLKGCGKYVEPELETYENNFYPHLTITGGIDDNQFKQAIKDLGKDTRCTGEINEIILSFVKKDTAKELKNPNNLTIFKL